MNAIARRGDRFVQALSAPVHHAPSSEARSAECVALPTYRGRNLVLKVGERRAVPWDTPMTGRVLVRFPEILRAKVSGRELELIGLKEGSTAVIVYFAN